MSRKSLQILFAVIAVLAVAFLAFESAEENTVQRDSSIFLSGLNSDQIERLKIEQGSEKVEVVQTGEVWGVLERSGYPADLNKLRALLLKLVDLSVSQRVTDSEKNYERLGVAAESYKKGFGEEKSSKVSLLDSAGKELAVVLLGERKKRGPGGETSAGQFIRKADSKDVYLLAESLEVSASPGSFIATDLLSISAPKVKRVVREASGQGKREKLYEMEAVKEAEGTTRFELDLEPGANQEIQQTIVNSISSGLENVRIEDVSREGEENSPTKGKNFDQVATYELTTGAVYEVQTLMEQNKGYARFTVKHDEKLAEATRKETQSQNERRRAEYDQKKKAAQEKKENFGDEFVELKPDVISKEEAERENKRLSGWVFELPVFQVEKYRRQQMDLIKDKAPAAK